jgi:hypothetical protein
MQPIGLTIKHRRNKYSTERDGELMIIHRCTRCATIVINRIAADDSAAAILEIFDDSWMYRTRFEAEFEVSEVVLLTVAERDLVLKRLFGDTVGNI